MNQLLNEINRSREIMGLKEGLEYKNYSELNNWNPREKRQPNSISRSEAIQIMKENYRGYITELENVLEKWVKKTQQELNLDDNEAREIETMFINDHDNERTESSLRTQIMGMEFPIFGEIPYLGGNTGGFDEYMKELERLHYDLVDEDVKYDDLQFGEEDIYDKYYLNDIPVEETFQQLKDEFDKQNG